ncbi:MAG: hypothetical protein NTW14_14235 [bacterium]|nr:hypothetical protein [bacterium]
MIRISLKLILLGVFCLALTSPLRSIAGIKPPFTLKVVWTSGFDDNILNYSDRDLTRFKNNQEVSRSAINTTDDWVNTFGIQAYRDFKLGRRFSFRPYYSGKLNLYSVNSIKNYSSHLFSARFAYRTRVYLTLEYFYLADYYLRIYRDRDWTEYHNCDFNLYQPAVKLRYRKLPWVVDLEYAREMIYYNSYFTEYDSRANLYGLKGTWEFPTGASVAIGYQFKHSDNIGYEPPQIEQTGNPNEETEAGDGSYEENRYLLEVFYPLPIDSDWNWHSGIKFQHRQRFYQSSLTLAQDAIHAGREDRRDIVKALVSVSPTTQLDLELSITFDVRRTTSQNSSVSAAKDFDDHALDLTLSYRLF